MTNEPQNPEFLTEQQHRALKEDLEARKDDPPTFSVSMPGLPWEAFGDLSDFFYECPNCGLKDAMCISTTLSEGLVTKRLICGSCKRTTEEVVGHY